MDMPKEAITLSYSWISKPSPPLTECVPARGRERESYSHTSLEWEGRRGREERRERKKRERLVGGKAL